MKTSLGIAQFLLVVGALFKLGTPTPTWYTAGDGNKYLIDGEYKYNWLQANNECARRGLQLVIIDNAEKNAALIVLLRHIFGKSHNLWLGYHDEFNTANDISRPFYELSTGEKTPFTYWKSGEPNNEGNNEHCAHIYQIVDFQWNDKKCIDNYGFICEDHIHTVKYRRDMQEKRKNVREKNNQISLDFNSTQSEITRINVNTLSATDSILLDLHNSAYEIVADLKKSIRDIIAKKPYLTAVIADLGDSIKKVMSEKETEFHKTSQEARLNIEKIHLSAERSINELNSDFENNLNTNSNEIDKLLVI